MKATLLSIALLIASITTAFSQYDVKPYNSSGRFSGIGEQECIAVKIYDIDIDDVSSDWKKVLKKKYDAKVKVSGKELFADNAEIETVSSNTVDVYSTLSKSSDGVIELKVAVDLGGAYLTYSGHADKHSQMTKIVGEFALKQTQKGIDERVEKAEDELEDLENELKKQQKTVANANKAIEDAEKKIVENKDLIKETEAAIKEQEVKIDDQANKVQKLKSISVRN